MYGRWNGLSLAVLVMLTTMVGMSGVAILHAATPEMSGEFCAPALSANLGELEPMMHEEVVGFVHHAAAWQSDEVRMLHDFFNNMGMHATGQYDGWKWGESRVASLMFEGGDGTVGTIIFSATVDPGRAEPAVIALRQAPIPDTVYRTATSYTVQNDVVTEGASIQMNGASPSPPFCPDGQCRVDQTCGGHRDGDCLFWWTFGCSLIPEPIERAACTAAGWFACWVPPYACPTCEPC